MLATATSLKHTPLHALHLARGAKMVPFAGYDMPVQYAAGVLREHLHTRSAAGLFDVSHMGQIALRPKSGKVEDAALALERLVPQDIVAVAPGRQRYAQFTNEDGGLLDDLMVANFGDHLFVVVNAACKAEDEAHLRAHLSDSCVIDSLADRALIALQGPKAESALAKLGADVNAMKFMDTGPRRVAGFDCFVSRSGYTGEDGFEISVPAANAEALATMLLGNPDVLPIGLGARDSLRLEAGLCLYGHDIDETTTPDRGRARLVDLQAPPRRGRLPRRRAHPGRARQRTQAPPRRHQARGPGPRPRWRRHYRCGRPAHRRRHLRRLRPQRQRPRRHGLCRNRHGRAGNAGAAHRPRQGAARRNRQASVHPQQFQTLRSAR